MSRDPVVRRRAPIVAIAASWLAVALAGSASAQIALAPETNPVQPADLVVDVDGLSPWSDGNGVFEPGERVIVVPFWMNATQEDIQLWGTSSRGLVGPAGATYLVTDGSASYGTIAPGTRAGCVPTGDCYELSVTPIPYGTRPTLHWDAVFSEEVIETATGTGTTQAWTLHLGDSFSDVPRTYPYYSFVETLLHKGVTGGCGGGQFCPSIPATREQMPVLVLAAAHPAGWTPPPCLGGDVRRFIDVPATNSYCPWIEEAALRGIVSSCADGPDFYCPTKPVHRGEMAQAVVAASHPFGYQPPACTGTWYPDVDASEPLCAWIEALAPNLPATIGPPPGPEDPTCSPEYFCPADIASRGVGSLLVVGGFQLHLYEP